MDNKRKNVLICPLNWGLGHATRCAPIIKKFLEKDFNVIIAAEKRPLHFFSEEFPDIKNIIFPGFDVKYSKSNTLIWKMLFNTPVFIFSIIKEHKTLKKIIKKYNIDIVVSDNRYGLWNKNVFSIFMTHQIIVKCPKFFKFLEYIFYKFNKFNISKYNECWIPDYKNNDNNLSGDLSHKYKLKENCYFIGPLSRFNSFKKNIPKTDIKKKYDILAILSGPEPQRTIFQEKIISQLKTTNLKAVIVKGITEKQTLNVTIKNIKIFSHLNTNDLLKYIGLSRTIICRSGYSSIMDMACIGRKAVFIPTPGQTEQEYLAKYLSEKKLFYFQLQKKLNILQAVKNFDKYSGLNVENNMQLLDERIKNCFF